jgi:hypothetical protein
LSFAGLRAAHRAGMPTVTIVIAALLIALGLVSRALSDSPSVTVLIPAFLGAALLLAGLVAFKAGARKHAMHVAAMLALFGIVGGAGALVHLPALLSGGEVQRPLAVASRSLTVLLCAVLLSLAVRSFIIARRARLASTTLN